MSLPAHDLENHMVIPQTDLMPRVKSPSANDVLDTIFAVEHCEPHKIEDMESVVDGLINQDTFTDALRALLNPETSEAQLKHLREYALNSMVANEVYAKHGTGEHTDIMKENVLEVAS